MDETGAREQTEHRVEVRRLAAVLALVAALAAIPYTCDDLAPLRAWSPPNATERLFAPDPRRLWVLRPGVSVRWAGEQVETNALGLRGADVTPDKPAGVRRVLCLGGSVVFGYRLRGEDTFPSQLQALLDEQSDTRYELINLGVPGYSSYQTLDQLRALADRLQPDVLITNNVLGDFTTDRTEDRLKVGPQRSRNIPQLLGLAPPEGAEWLIGRELLARPVEGVPRVSLEDYRANLTELVAIGQAHGARTVFMVTPVILREQEHDAQTGPERAKRYFDTQREVAAATGSLLVDVHGAMESRLVGVSNPLLIDDCHPTAWGNREIAGHLAWAVQELERGSDGGAAQR